MEMGQESESPSPSNLGLALVFSAQQFLPVEHYWSHLIYIIYRK